MDIVCYHVRFLIRGTLRQYFALWSLETIRSHLGIVTDTSVLAEQGTLNAVVGFSEFYTCITLVSANGPFCSSYWNIARADLWHDRMMHMASKRLFSLQKNLRLFCGRYPIHHYTDWNVVPDHPDGLVITAVVLDGRRLSLLRAAFDAFLPVLR